MHEAAIFLSSLGVQRLTFERFETWSPQYQSTGLLSLSLCLRSPVVAHRHGSPLQHADSNGACNIGTGVLRVPIHHMQQSLQLAGGARGGGREKGWGCRAGGGGGVGGAACCSPCLIHSSCGCGTVVHGMLVPAVGLPKDSDYCWCVARQESAVPASHGVTQVEKTRRGEAPFKLQ